MALYMLMAGFSAVPGFISRIGIFLQRHPITIALHLSIFGLCLIFFSRIQPMFSTVQLSEVLYGENFATSLGCLFVAAAPVFYGCYFLRQREVDWFSITVFIIAAVVSLHYIHISNNWAYTNDWNGHLAHAQFLSKNWLSPYGYRGWQSHHPPTYFYIAAAVIWLTDFMGSIPMLTALRFLSWMCFLVFQVYNLLTLRKEGLRGMVYYVSVCLLLMWPASLHLASKISDEPLYYAFYAASFYYTLSWYKKGSQAFLIKAVLLAAFTFTIRTNAILIFAVMGVLVLVALYRRRVYIYEFLTMRWIFIALFIVACCFINLANVLIYNFPLDMHLGYTKPGQFALSHYFSLNWDYTLKQPFNDFSINQSFWDFLLKTSIFGEYTWPSLELASMLNLFLTAILFYSLLPWLFVARAQWRGMLPYIVNLVIPLIFLLWFSFRMPAFCAQDARFIYPSLVCFVVLFGKAQEMYREREAVVLTWLGPILAVSFSLLSVYFFWNNAR